jgi:PAS domain S-box-containing protein
MMQTSLFGNDPFDKRSPFKAQERARRKRLVVAISTGLIPALIPVAAVFGIMLAFNQSWQILTTLIITTVMIVLSYITRQLGQREQTTVAGYVLLVAFLVLIGANGLLIDGLAPAVAPSYGVIVVMAGMMLGVQGGIVIGLLASAMWLLVQFEASAGVLPPPLRTSSPVLEVTVVIVVLDFLFTAYMSYLATEDLQQALDDTTYELVRVNRQLEEANAEAKRAKERVEAILDNSPDATLLLRGAEGGITTANPSFYRMFGFAPSEMAGASILNLTEESYAKILRKAFLTVINRGGTVFLEVVARKKNGDTFDAGIALASIEDEQLVKGFVCSIRDISERVRSEEKVRQALSEREVLLKEIHHRVKNNLQIVSSLLNLGAHSLHDEAARQFFIDSQTRVQSMALIHEQLYQAGNLSLIDFNEYIKGLASYLASSYEGSDKDTRGNVSVKVMADKVQCPIDVAIPCGLIINELISNAYKHAFPENREGKIIVTFRVRDGAQVRLMVQDDGVGIPVKTGTNNNSSSLGMQLVEQLVKQLSGNLDIDTTTGTRFTIDFDLNQNAAEPARSL